LLSNELIAKENLYAVLDSFVKENNKNEYVYEIYIDKLNPHQYMLTIYGGTVSLTEEENKYNNQVPVSFTMVSGKKFNIYSGVEHYFEKMNDTIKSSHSSLIYDRNVWVIKDSFNIITIYRDVKDIYSYPFMALPVSFPKRFSPPQELK
jgi:hypothetical protein